LGLRRTIRDSGSSGGKLGRGKELGGIQKSLPNEYKWECQGAKREKKKGRAIGGIITGMKLGIKEKGEE
jgi:hypothetical protein